MGDVFVGIEPIRQRELIQRGSLGGDDFFDRWIIGEQSPAELGEGEVSRAGDEDIGQLEKWLFLPLVADFGAAQHDDEIGPHPLEQCDDLGGFRDVPDIDAEADDARLFGQQRFGDVQRALRDDEFPDGGIRLQLAHIRQQIAQAKRGMEIAGVQGREQDGRHGGRLRKNGAL